MGEKTRLVIPDPCGGLLGMTTYRVLRGKLETG